MLTTTPLAANELASADLGNGYVALDGAYTDNATIGIRRGINAYGFDMSAGINADIDPKGDITPKDTSWQVGRTFNINDNLDFRIEYIDTLSLTNPNDMRLDAQTSLELVWRF